MWPKASDEEIQRAIQMRKTGIASKDIAATLGRSEAVISKWTKPAMKVDDQTPRAAPVNALAAALRQAWRLSLQTEASFASGLELSVLDLRDLLDGRADAEQQEIAAAALARLRPHPALTASRP